MEFEFRKQFVLIELFSLFDGVELKRKTLRLIVSALMGTMQDFDVERLVD